jgi:hypothetical protein
MVAGPLQAKLIPMTTTSSNAQRAILILAAATRGRLVAPKHVTLKGGAVRIVLLSLVRKGLLEEVGGLSDAHAWLDGEDGERMGLKVTAAGCEAVGVNLASGTELPSSAKAFRAGTKQAALIAMLQRMDGATIHEMVEATGWLRNTVSGALAGAIKKRLGMEVTSEKIEGRGRVYRVA